MKVTIKKPQTFEAAILEVSAGFPYWEDATVNGVKDEDGTLMPFRVGDYWKPTIDVNTGQIKDWPQGTTANIHYKICDDGTYTLKTAEGETILEKDGYVPDIMCPGDEGYGDYIIMTVNESGVIEGWKQTLSGFDLEDED